VVDLNTYTRQVVAHITSIDREDDSLLETIKDSGTISDLILIGMIDADIENSLNKEAKLFVNAMHSSEISAKKAARFLFYIGNSFERMGYGKTDDKQL